MASCTYCGQPAGIGKDCHPDCRDNALANPATPAELELAKALSALEPVMKRAVFRGTMKAAFAMTAIWFAIGLAIAIVKNI